MKDVSVYATDVSQGWLKMPDMKLQDMKLQGMKIQDMNLQDMTNIV